jgi:type VI secretion system secreted protein Hcp
MAFDAFLKIDGVQGEATDKTYNGKQKGGWIDVLSFTYGVTQTGAASTSGGLTAGKANLNDFTFTQKVHIGSPEIFIRCATGKVSKTVNFVARKAGGDAQLDFLKIDMINVLITSVSSQGSGGPDEIPTETVSMTCEEMKIFYAEQNAAGGADRSLFVAFNQKENVKK